MDSNPFHRFERTGPKYRYDELYGFDRLGHGNHTIKFGGDFRDVRSTSNVNFNWRDDLSFNRFQDSGGTNPAFVQGTPDQARQDLTWLLVGGVSRQFQAQFFNKNAARVPTDSKSFRQREFDVFINFATRPLDQLSLPGEPECMPPPRT